MPAPEGTNQSHENGSPVPDQNLAGQGANLPESDVPRQSDQTALEREVEFSYELHGEVIQDNFQWLEEVRSTEALAFVERQNQKTFDAFENATYQELVEELTRRNTADDLQMPDFGKRVVVKFKAEPDLPKGKLLIGSKEEFFAQKADTPYETLIDIGELAEREGRDWIYHGYSEKPGLKDRIMIYLSDGGTDACLVREFDLSTREFVEGGFELEGLVSASYIGKGKEIIFEAPTDETNTSSSGYALEVKKWSGEGPLEESESLFRAPADHMGVGHGWMKLGKKRSSKRLVVTDMIDFYSSKSYVFSKDLSEKTEIPLPEKSTVLSCHKGMIYFQPEEQFALGEKDYQGGLVAFDLKAFVETGQEKFRGIFLPEEGQALEDAFVYKNKLYLQYIENVVSKIARSEFKAGQVRSDEGLAIEFSEIELPGTGTVNAFYTVKGRGICVGYTDFVTPQSYYFLGKNDQALGEPFLRKPEKFDASSVEVSQQWATSKDGTQVPFFVLDGREDKTTPAPTIQYGYGGFQVSLQPSYSWTKGACWLEKGGVYVVANIRGGGEFGPKWHQAALGENRHKAYEDMAAVADKIVDLGLSTPEQLGTTGGSNGGLLAGNMFTRYPEKFAAVVSEVPLLDMLRFDQLLRGDSWTGEYGSPKKAEDIPQLKEISAYHNIDPEKEYPPVMFTTSTADDRVHPCHARKTAALAQKLLDSDVYFYEQTDGGHGSGDFNSWIKGTALVYSFFWDKLSQGGAGNEPDR